MTSILVQSKDRDSSLNVSASCFLGFRSLDAADTFSDAVFKGSDSGGQDAIARRGPVALEVENCLFGPHAVLFRLEGNTPEAVPLRIRHCSALLGHRSAVFEAASGASARIECSTSLFSRPGEPSPPDALAGKGAVLLRQASRQDNVQFEGRQNRYHQLDRCAIAGASNEEERNLLEELKKKDEESRVLLGDPWKELHPLKRLEAKTIPDLSAAIEEAFHVNYRLPALRLTKPDGKLIGAESVLAFSYGDDLFPLDSPPKEEGRRELVVVEKGESDPLALQYPSLKHALLDAQPGDIVRLRIKGELTLEPLTLEEKLSNLTLRADPGFHPVLTLGGTTAVNESSALFKLASGQLRLENLEIRLRAREDDSVQSVVYFLGDGECVLSNCLITLDRAGRKTALAVLPEKLRMKKSGRGARLSLFNCFVRGQGNLFCSQGGQLAELTLRNSLIALTGSLVNVESEKDTDRETPPSLVSLHLRRTTTYLGDHLIRVRAGKDLGSVAKVLCAAEDCLFLPAPASNARALVHLEGPATDETGLMGKFAWVQGNTNAYGQFATLLEQQSLGEMPPRMPTASELDNWKSNKVSGESASEYNVKLTKQPAVDAPLGQLLPSAFRSNNSLLKDYGADLAALVLLPVLQHAKSEAESELLDFPPE